MSAWIDFFKSCSTFSGQLHFDEPLVKHTYFKIGGPAALVAVPKTELDLKIIAERIRLDSIPFFILGLGSNLLAPDAFSNCLYIKTTSLSQEIIEEGGSIKANSGVSVASFLRRAATEGWDDFEFMSGIPGTLGGVVAMNGGTHLGEASTHLSEVSVFSLKSCQKKTFRGNELRFSYRKNHFLEEGDLILDALWKMKRGDPKLIREKLDSLYRRRKETQPLDFPSCGSVFKNPENTSLRAWEVIEKLGLRGHRIGNAQIADKHPNWILNRGGATAQDVVALIELVKKRAKSELSIEMHEEVKVLNPWR